MNLNRANITDMMLFYIEASKTPVSINDLRAHLQLRFRYVPNDRTLKRWLSILELGGYIEICDNRWSSKNKIVEHRY